MLDKKIETVIDFKCSLRQIHNRGYSAHHF